ncbi:MAG: AAA family ATPase [Anaerolineae bacterium]
MPGLISGEMLRILLISSNEAVRNEVGVALAGRAGDHRLYWVSQPDLAAGRARDLLPHVILVDSELGGASPITVILALGEKLPAVPILALVNTTAIDLAREAVLAGARAFVTKPIQADDLLAALRGVLTPRSTGAEAAERESGRVIVFCAPKGGTGRTTLAINTAIALHQRTHEPVVLVDADYAAPAVDVALNLVAQKNIADLLPRMSRLDADLVASILATHASGIRVLLAPPPADLSTPISLPQVQQVLVWLKRMFSWVIVDLGLPLDDTAFAFLDGADRIVMSVLPEMVGLRNTRLMLDQLAYRGYPDEKVWLVLNRSTMRGGVPAADIEARLQVRLRYRIPDDQPLATHTINRGVPIVVSHAGSALGRALIEFADELRQELAPSSQAEAGPARSPLAGLLARWTGRLAQRPGGAT